MLEQISNIFTRISLSHMNILLLLGLALFGGIIGGRLFQKFRIPQVVGYIAIGILCGQSGFNIINKDIIQALQPFNYFALGLIGFMIGGELKKEVFRRYGKQFTVILLAEGLIAFLIVFLLVGIVGSFIFKAGGYFWALGLLLGAIASATAPAATTDVIWEYKARGPLTTTILGIVAMDDALALILFTVAATIVGRILGQTNGSLVYAVSHTLYEIGGAVLVGGVSGVTLSKMLKKYTESERILAFSLGAVLFVLGFSQVIKVDMLLSAMTLGAIVVNYIPRISKEVFNLVASFAAPIYVLFFVLVGAKLNVQHMTFPILVIAGVYLIGRSLGKMTGANLGAKVSGAPQTVQKYLPFCLFSQAGVAIGLSIAAYHTFPGDMGNSIVIIITASTFIVQLIGPSCVKYAITKAGEVGLNIGEEDVVRRIKVKDVMDENPPVIYENTSLGEVLNIFSRSIYHHYPVIDKGGKLSGIITVDSIRRVFTHMDLGDFLLAHDIMEQAFAKVFPETSLMELKETMDRYALDYLPVVTPQSKLAGFVERRMVNRFISAKLLEFERQNSNLSQAVKHS